MAGNADALGMIVVWRLWRMLPMRKDCPEDHGAIAADLGGDVLRA
ncbi:hypothetical protein QPR87_16790 [Paracoccus sp. SSJ]|nr:hypothetical protein [Paracoccus sp. SSJ]